MRSEATPTVSPIMMKGLLKLQLICSSMNALYDYQNVKTSHCCCIWVYDNIKLCAEEETRVMEKSNIKLLLTQTGIYTLPKLCKVNTEMHFMLQTRTVENIHVPLVQYPTSSLCHNLSHFL